MVARRDALRIGGLSVVGLALAAACGAPNTGQSGGSSAGRLRVGLVTDVGKVDDKSFNQSAWEGVQRAQKELGAEVRFVETTDPKDYAKNIDQFATSNYTVIVTVGFGLGEATTAAAKKYQNVKFIGVDQFQAPGQEVANLSGLIFDEDKAGFLAGALAAQMSKSGIIGQVLGTDVVPPVVKFGRGYEAGAKFARSDIRVLTWYHPGGLARGFTDPEEGKKQALQMISQNADVIFGAGGQTGNGALLGCAERNVMAIGVDTDQYLTLPQAQKVLLSSAMKLITPGVFNDVKAVRDNTFKGGNFVGEVGLAPYHDFENVVPAAVKERMTSIDKGLKDGTIKTGVTL
jgi:basic membrane protein A and related proteins